MLSASYFTCSSSRTSSPTMRFASYFHACFLHVQIHGCLLTQKVLAFLFLKHSSTCHSHMRSMTNSFLLLFLFLFTNLSNPSSCRSRQPAIASISFPHTHIIGSFGFRLPRFAMAHRTVPTCCCGHTASAQSTHRLSLPVLLLHRCFSQAPSTLLPPVRSFHFSQPISQPPRPSLPVPLLHRCFSKAISTIFPP